MAYGCVTLPLSVAQTFTSSNNAIVVSTFKAEASVWIYFSKTDELSFYIPQGSYPFIKVYGEY